MLQSFSKKAALLLLPVLVHALVLPSELLDDRESTSDSSRYNFESPSYGGPSTFFEYDIDDHSIKFSIPCPDCSDEEKELLKQEIISVRPTAQNTQHCASTDPIGLEIDDKQVISTGESSLTLQSHIGPFHLLENSRHHIFNRTRWINHCGCTKQHLDDEECDEDFQSSFSFEVLGLPSGQIPGFTVSYKQNGKPELLRFSSFPDTGIADSWRFGQSEHYKSPLLRLQKAVIPTSTGFLSSSPSFRPSLTASASSPSYTSFEKTPTKSIEILSPAVPTPSEVRLLSQSSGLFQKVSIPSILDHIEHKEGHWCRLPNVLDAFRHGIDAVAMRRTKSRDQIILGKTETIVPLSASMAQPTSRPVAFTKADQKHENDPVIASHDELDDDSTVVESVASHDDEPARVELDSVEDLTYIDLPVTSSFWNDPTAVKAFQVTSLVFIVAALSGSLFALARCNPRLRAKWATVLEEHRNQRLYRHAARKQRFQKFFSRFRSSCPHEKNQTSAPFTQDDNGIAWREWEQKQAILASKQTSDVDGLTISRDLLAFRKAHQFVDGIVAAEEGRRSTSRREHHNASTYRPRHQRTWSFGSEKTAPPPYESDGEDLILDADGPRLVVVRRGRPNSDNSPDSSVISTSPRGSCADSDSEHDEKF